MVSYSWEQQAAVLKIVDELKGRFSLDVWVDVEQMEGSTVDSMAGAVENASVVVICEPPLPYATGPGDAPAD